MMGGSLEYLWKIFIQHKSDLISRIVNRVNTLSDLSLGRLAFVTVAMTVNETSDSSQCLSRGWYWIIKSFGGIH